jgi:hypothetical protein
MTPDFRIGQGDLPKIVATLADANGSIDLAGCSVAFLAQETVSESTFGGNATILQTTDPDTKGQVQFVPQAGQTETTGLYRAQWTVTDQSGNTRLFPTASLDDDDAHGRYLIFEIVPRLPLRPADNVTPISDTYEVIRAIMGDFDVQFRKHEDTAIASVVRSVVSIGKLPGYAITPDRRSIAPALAMPRDLGLLTLHSAKMFLLPNVADYSYRRRAMGERFGRQEHFLFDLQAQIDEYETGGGVFTTFQSFYGWVNALTGLNIWSVMSDMKTRAPVASVIIGRAGITVNTT